MNRIILCICFALVWVVVASNIFAESVTLQPVADTTLHEKFKDNNLGAQFDLAAGGTASGERTRALLRFDFGGKLPPSAVITSATLTVRVTKEPSSGGVNSTFELRRVQRAWTEGAKTGLTGEPATAGEATWNNASHPDGKWAEAGGKIGTDFADAISATAHVAARGTYTFRSSAPLVADVQQWLAKPEENFGWVLLSQSESTRETARRFASRQGAANAPSLTIEYTLSAPPPPEIRITGITIDGSEGQLSWTGGGGPFQLQRRVSLSEGGWTNLGEPVTVTSSKFSVEGNVAFFRVVQATSAPPPPETAEYEVSFKSDWSAASHPQDFPSNFPHWSPLIGGTHNANVAFWEEGGIATQGIEDMAELGSVVALRNEINAAISAQNAFNVLTRPGSIPASGTAAINFTVHRNFPLVTLVTMIAPSPDWFTGVHGLNLLENGQWANQKTVTLHLYDAGTDSGPTYNSLDSDTQPREMIRQITGFPALVNGQIVPFATFTFTRK